MLIKHLPIAHEHSNGTSYITLELTQQLIKAKLMSIGPRSQVLILHIAVISNESAFLAALQRVSFLVIGSYFPIKLIGHKVTRYGQIVFEGCGFCHDCLCVGFGRCGYTRACFICIKKVVFEHVKYVFELT
jgi:hypothetical protein